MQPGEQSDRSNTPDKGILHSSKAKYVTSLYQRLLALIDIETAETGEKFSYPTEALIPHTALRQQLLSDPATCALLSGCDYIIAPENLENSPYQINSDGLILISSALLDDVHALACATRWALEARYLQESNDPKHSTLIGLKVMAAELIGMLPEKSREALFEVVPPKHATDFLSSTDDSVSDGALRWLSSIMGWPYVAITPEENEDRELFFPLETILARGGDSRLIVDPVTKLNRYGVPLRPRPEAVHFSSSTASPISEYGFLFCDTLRRDLLSEHQRTDTSLEKLREKASHAVGTEILKVLGLQPEEADTALTPSGTDAELLTVLISSVAASGKPVLNILIAPEETGRGVRFAATGCYFDDLTPTGEHVLRGSPALNDQTITTQEISIRNGRGLPRTLSDIDAEVLETGQRALKEGHHLLVHVLMSSKTGLSAPSHQAVDSLVALGPDRVNVVVDACQMRTPLVHLGQLVRKGWMLQITGSKFLTGPPFSGALIVPKTFLNQASAVGNALQNTVGIGHRSDWTQAWKENMPAQDKPSAGFGPIFRWLPALLEAELFSSLTLDFRKRAFDRFKQELVHVISRSMYIKTLNSDQVDDSESNDNFLRLSIISFEILARKRNGHIQVLNETECRRLYECLNSDVSDIIPNLSPRERSLARLEIHVGQPVTLHSQRNSICVLRLVLGARFFTFVGLGTEKMRQAALQSEINDAKSAIAKIELLVKNWIALEDNDSSA